MSDHSGSEPETLGQDLDWISEDAELPVKSFFCDTFFPTTRDLVDFESSQFNFNIPALAVDLQIRDDHSIIKLINYIRSYVGTSDYEADEDFIKALIVSIKTRDFLAGDMYLKPVLVEDPLLFQLPSFLGIGFDDEEEGNDKNGNMSWTDSGIEQQKRDLEEVRGMVQNYSKLTKEILSQESEPTRSSYYFDGYSSSSIHEEMLRDESRTNAYLQAFSENLNFIKDKVVLDVGCGSGILSLVAARYGCKHIFGIDASEIIPKAQNIVSLNGYSDKITLIQGLIESNPEELESVSVDILVSEWMGYGLYFENMLSSVIYARDKYLNMNYSASTLFPNESVLYIEPMTVWDEKEDRVSWWKSVYGFDMSCCFQEEVLEYAQVQSVPIDYCIGTRCHMQTWDLNRIRNEDLDFSLPFETVISKESILRAFVISFDVNFNHPLMAQSVVLSTTPSSPDTHWKQTVLWLKLEYRRLLSVNDRVIGTLRYQRKESNPREYDLTLSWSIATSSSEHKANIETPEFSQMYSLS